MAAAPAIINNMIKAAEAASISLIRDFGEVEHLQVSQKSPANFVSAADTRAEQILHDQLKKIYPQYSYKMEEKGFIEGAEPHKIFHIDPLDGTHNFIHGVPQWCISIALEDDGQIIAGVIFDPVKDELFWAAKGLGAFVHNNRRLRVSARKDIHSCLFTSGAYTLIKDEKSDIATLQKLLRSSMGVRRTGSTALDLAYVAAGRYDAFWGTGSQSWDVAAGIIIIKEAGGQISSLRDKESAISGNAILASSAAIHQDLLSHLKITSKS